MLFTKNQKCLLIIGIILTFLSIFALNILFPMYIDDRVYSILKCGESVEFPDTFIEIIQYQYHHYLKWGGRVVAHLILQLLLLFSPIVQDILNSLAYTLFICQIYRMANLGRKINFSLFILINFLVFFFIPRFASDILWMTGSANYLWTTLIILLFMFPYYKFSIEGTNDKKTLLKTCCMFVCGIIAGWTNENMAPAMIIMLLAYLFYYKKNMNKTPSWAIWGIIGSIIGCLFLLLSPGNFNRLEQSRQYNTIPESALSEAFFEKLSNLITSYYIPFLLPIAIVFIILLVIFYKREKDNKNRKAVLFNSILFFIAAEIAFFAIILSPVFPIRALFGLIIFKIISISILYANISLKNIFLKCSVIAIIILLLIPCSIDYYRTFKALELFSTTYKEREEIIIAQKAKGENNIVFTKEISLHYKLEYLELGPDNDKYWSRYYGVESVRLITEK